MSAPFADVLPSESVALPQTEPAARPEPAASAAAPRRSRSKPPDWLREPLLHFVALGGLLFVLDYALLGDAEAASTIVVGPEVNSEAVHTFEKLRGRKPNHQELEALHRVWLDNEVLYREGLALGVDKGDPAIRERVIFKALSVVDSNVKLPPADEKTLRTWFEARRSKYDEPARFDFEEGALSGNASEADVRAFVAALNAGTPGDAKAGLRVFKARPRPNLLESYGPEFTQLLEAAQPGVWHALKTKDGWRAIKLNAMTAPRPAVFEAIQGPVLQDWKDTLAAEQRTAAVRALAKKYEIEFSDAHECAADE
ncbi:MAG TPA: peptidylprolyl isomerase [Polyangiaceae bacterium]|nr:peptidylprolyl isomerase [Polyangiaceae bacterium]